MSVYKDDLRPIELSGVRTYPLASRSSKVLDFRNLLVPYSLNLPCLISLTRSQTSLAVRSLRELSVQIIRARRLNKPIIWGIGGHVVKTGLAPVITDLMRRGFITAIAANGSVLVHDAEIAMVGTTSEDVDASLGSGIFGAAEETGRVMNTAAQQGARDDLGLGESLGRALLNSSTQTSGTLFSAQPTNCAFPLPRISQSAPISHTSTRRLMARRSATQRIPTFDCFPNSCAVWTAAAFT
ncbi:MAG: hypothetical protein WKF84_24075 [Pyrinomonadaceae bacterium]